MNEKKLVIFDMDGTLLDSMPYWEHLGRNYLLQKGIDAPPQLEETIETMTLNESADYFREVFGLTLSREEIIREIGNLMDMAYRFEIPAKRGMKKLVREAKEKGMQVVVLTTSDQKLAKVALKRTGLLSYFDAVYTADQFHMGKNGPEIYERVCQLHHCAPEKTVVYEDALYAIKAAREAGCHVIAVYDPSMESVWDQIRSLSEEQIIHHKC